MRRTYTKEDEQWRRVDVYRKALKEMPPEVQEVLSDLSLALCVHFLSADNVTVKMRYYAEQMADATIAAIVMKAGEGARRG